MLGVEAEVQDGSKAKDNSRVLSHILGSLRNFNLNEPVSFGGSFRPTNKCPGCGSPVETDFLICPECGHEFENASGEK
jgi:rRNA maturation endonuclease Nob1